MNTIRQNFGKPMQVLESVALSEHGVPLVCPRERDRVPSPQLVEHCSHIPQFDHDPSSEVKDMRVTYMIKAKIF